MGKRLSEKDLLDILQIYRRKRLTYESIPVNRMDMDYVHMEINAFDYAVTDFRVSILQDGQECVRLPLKEEEIWLNTYRDENLNQVLLITLERRDRVCRTSLRLWEEESSVES